LPGSDNYFAIEQVTKSVREANNLVGEIFGGDILMLAGSTVQHLLVNFSIIAYLGTPG
jgi:Na+-translocating ferredoxin:NAD+ oxidoreductase RnfG subunit